MATLALFAVGSMVGPSLFGSGVTLGLSAAALGGSIGAVLGGYIDQALIYPALFGGQGDIQGQRVDDTNLQTASEGSPINWCLGPRTRVAGTVIWFSELIEVEDSQSVGGKGGGGGGAVSTFEYFRHGAIGVCLGPINKIKRIWADSKLIYKDASDTYIDITDTDISAAKARALVFNPLPLPGEYVVDKHYLVLSAPNGGSDLSQFRSGEDVVVSGFTFDCDITSAMTCVAETVDGAACMRIFDASGDFDLTAFESGGNVVVTGFTNPVNNGTFRAFRSGFVTGLGWCLYLKNSSAATDSGATVRLRQTTTGAEIVHNNLRIYKVSATQMAVIADVDGPDLTTFKPGTNLTTSGFATGANNGTFAVVSTGYDLLDEGDEESYVIVTNNTPSVTELAGATATLTGTRFDNNGTFECARAEENADGSTSVYLLFAHGTYRAAGDTVVLHQESPAFDPSIATDIRIYLGTAVQNPDDLIEAHVGAADTPAYRGTAYVVFERLALRDFGNRFPNMEFLVEAQSALTRAAAIEAVLNRTGFLDADYYDTSMVTGNFQGMVIAGPQPIASQLEPILVAYDINVVEDDGQMLFIDRTIDNDELVKISVADEHISAHGDGEQMPPRLSVTEVAMYDLPQEVNVKYIDPGTNFQQGSVTKRKITHVAGPGHDSQFPSQAYGGVTQLDVPLTLFSSIATKLAVRRLWAAHAERRQGTVTLPPSYLYVREGDILAVRQTPTEKFLLRVTDVSRGANFMMLCNGTLTEDGTFDFTDPSDADDLPIDTELGVYQPPAVIMILLQTAPLRDLDIETPGFYIAMCAEGYTAPWLGSAVFGSSDDATFGVDASVPYESTICLAMTTLGDVASHASWDLINTVDVKLLHGSLESHTANEVLGGANRMWLGGEIIGFQTATLISGTTYRLSGLLRGRRDTADLTGTHQTNEYGVLLSTAGQVFESINRGDVGTTRYYKGVPTGAAEGDIDSVATILAGNTIRPFSPCHLEVDEEASGNLVITWVRRTRALIRLFTTPAPLIDPEETYEIDFVDSGGTVVRTVIVNDVTEATYSQADQVADGTDADTVTIRVYQTNEVGRSKPAEITVAT